MTPAPQHNNIMKKNRVVVTGLGIASPVGIGIENFWESTLQGKSGISRTEAYDPSAFQIQLSAELPDFDFKDFVPKSYRKNAKVMARDISIALVSSYLAVKHAGINTKCIIDRKEAEGSPNIDSTRFGANIGAGLICADLDELAGALSTAAENDQFSLKKWGVEGMSNLTPLWLLKFLPNMLACHVTIVHDAQAPSNTITCGEASSHLAIGEAYRTIQRGNADVCICGGAESKINPMATARMQLMNFCNTESNSDPEHALTPFSENGQGIVPSEGGGLIILENLEHAQQRNANILAEIVGFGGSTNVKSWAQEDETGAPTTSAINNALNDANVSASDVELCNPFGTGIGARDLAELKGWQQVFGDSIRDIPALCTTGSNGINGAGTGAIEFAATVMSVLHNTVPPSTNADSGSFAFANKTIDAKINLAVSTSNALTGGQHAALVLKKFQ